MVLNFGTDFVKKAEFELSPGEYGVRSGEWKVDKAGSRNRPPDTEITKNNKFFCLFLQFFTILNQCIYHIKLDVLLNKWFSRLT